MKSALPKVLHQVCGRPMLDYVLDLVQGLKIKKTILVLGRQHQEVKKILKPGIKVAIQKRPLGTADAVKVALARTKKGFKDEILILYADNPLLKKETIKKLLDYHLENSLDATLLTTHTDNPAGYGRILRDEYESISGIVEEKDADDFQKSIKEINTGIICFNKQKLIEAIKHVRPNNKKKEYYLTDVISVLHKKGCLIDNIKITNIDEALGINSRSDLARAGKIMQQRINEEFMQRGITLIDPATTFISYGVRIGEDSVIYPFTVIERNVKIGKRCQIGPFIHLREGSYLEDDVVVGNFIEITRSRIGAKTFFKHFGYLGDSLVGRRVNIGAGTVTANFDGKNKNTTVIKDRAFIGSDTIIVAPVKIGKAAKTGAGSVVIKNRNVPDGAVVAGIPARLIRKFKISKNK